MASGSVGEISRRLDTADSYRPTSLPCFASAMAAFRASRQRYEEEAPISNRRSKRVLPTMLVKTEAYGRSVGSTLVFGDIIVEVKFGGL